MLFPGRMIPSRLQFYAASDKALTKCPWIFFCFHRHLWRFGEKKKGTKCFWKGWRLVRRMKVGQGIFHVQFACFSTAKMIHLRKGNLASCNWWEVRMFAGVVSHLSPRRQLHPLWPETGQISGQTDFEQVIFTTFGVKSVIWSEVRGVMCLWTISLSQRRQRVNNKQSSFATGLCLGMKSNLTNIGSFNFILNNIRLSLCWFWQQRTWHFYSVSD